MGTRRTQPGPITDPRMGGLFPGVANREARAVYDARSARIRDALRRGDEPQLAHLLYEARRVGLWRAGRLTSFAAWTEEVLELPVARAQELAERGARELGVSLDRLPDPIVALWLRAEAVLGRACPEARAGIVGDAADASLSLTLPVRGLSGTLDALVELGQSADALRRVLTGR